MWKSFPFEKRNTIYFPKPHNRNHRFPSQKMYTYISTKMERSLFVQDSTPLRMIFFSFWFFSSTNPHAFNNWTKEGPNQKRSNPQHSQSIYQPQRKRKFAGKPRNMHAHLWQRHVQVLLFLSIDHNTTILLKCICWLQCR